MAQYYENANHNLVRLELHFYTSKELMAFAKAINLHISEQTTFIPIDAVFTEAKLNKFDTVYAKKLCNALGLKNIEIHSRLSEIPSEYPYINDGAFSYYNYIFATYSIEEYHKTRGKIMYGGVNTKEETDDVHHPNHYASHSNSGNSKIDSIECMNAIEASMTKEEFHGYLKGCIEKYIWRFKYKGTPLKDLNKANEYLEILRDRIAHDSIDE